MIKKEIFKDKIRPGGKYLSYMFKWSLCSLICGTVCGLAGAVFHYSVDIASSLRETFSFLLFFLPIAGVFIVFVYKICKMQNDRGTNTVISAVRSGEKVPILMAPLILIGTTFTHLCGGSSGREGAALQIGGSIGAFLGNGIKSDESDKKVMVMCGMSAVFSAVFGTPLTAAIFSIEVASVGIMQYNALFPCFMSAVFAHSAAKLLGVHSTAFKILVLPEFSYLLFVKILFLAMLCALLSSIFIISMRSYSNFASKFIKNPYLKAALGGAVVVILTLIIGSDDYNGVGMPVIKSAIEEGAARPEAFILKLILTVITLSSGFKGGEILPSFFIGSTFGAFAAPFLGIEPSFAAAIGLIAFFCGVVNCPIASIVLALEIFGGDNFILFAAAVSVSYIVSGYYSLYSSQKFAYSKLVSPYSDKKEDA